MLPLDLARLSRESSLRVVGQVGPEDPLWEGAGVRLESPLTVDLRANQARSGEIVVRGTVVGTLAQECRRCLDPLEVSLREEVIFVFAPPDVLGAEEDGEVRVLPLGAREVDLAKAVREEVILAAAPYPLCDPECRGLCPRCGADWNKTTCACAVEEPDPRWDVLRALKNE